jgi:hypothetical protein
MTTGEIVSSVLAIIALIISGVTAYLSFFAKFKVTFWVKRRVILTKIQDVPHVILECEFFNEGAKQGSVEDIILTIVHSETGNEFKFLPQYARSQYNIFSEYKLSDFSNFSGVSLKPKDRKELYIAFKPTLDKNFLPPHSGTFAISTAASDGNTNYMMTASTFTIPLTKEIVEQWIGESAKALQVEAIELAKSRQKYFGNRQR